MFSQERPINHVRCCKAHQKFILAEAPQPCRSTNPSKPKAGSILLALSSFKEQHNAKIIAQNHHVSTHSQDSQAGCPTAATSPLSKAPSSPSHQTLPKHKFLGYKRRPREWNFNPSARHCSHSTTMATPWCALQGVPGIWEESEKEALHNTIRFLPGDIHTWGSFGAENEWG